MYKRITNKHETLVRLFLNYELKKKKNPEGKEHFFKRSPAYVLIKKE